MAFKYGGKVLTTIAILFYYNVLVASCFNLFTELSKGLNTVKDPLYRGIITVGSKQCENLKRLIGVSYEQVIGYREPDLNKLTLVYRTQSYDRSYNLTTSADDLIESDDFVKNGHLVIFVHGFTEDPTSDSSQTVSDAYLSLKGYNIMLLDGSSLIRWLYLQSSTFVRFIGRELGATLAELVINGQNPDKITIIGHSLGSHIAGFAGKTFNSLTGLKLARIVGLDPAGPCFTDIDHGLRLNRNDAKYVDVIHTDAGVYGLEENIGHADYYVNGGSKQPNCLIQVCSHLRAWVYYSESVKNPKAFPAIKCRDWNTFKQNECDEDDISYMGINSKGHGTYYLRTNDESPYGLGEDGLTYSSQGFVDSLKDSFSIINNFF